MNKATISSVELAARIAALKSEFSEQLRGMRKHPLNRCGFSKKQIGDLEAGFADGLRSMYRDLVSIGVLEIREPGA